MANRSSGEETPMDLSEELTRATEAGWQAGTTLSTESSSTNFSGGIVEASPGSISEGRKIPAAMEDDKPEDYDEFVSWLKEEEVSEKSIQCLVGEGFNSFYALMHIQESDLKGMGLKKGQMRNILDLAKSAKDKVKERESTPGGPAAPQPGAGKSAAVKKRKMGGISLGNVSMTCRNVSGKVSIVSTTNVRAPGVHDSSFYGPVSAGVMGSVGAEAAAEPLKSSSVKTGSKSAKHTNLKDWLKDRQVTENSWSLLEEEGFDSFQKLTKIHEDDIQELGVNRAQMRLLEAAAEDLKARKEKGSFPFNKADKDSSSSDDESVEIKDVTMDMQDVTGDVSLVRREKITSDRPVYRHDYYGPVTAGVIGDVAQGADVGSIQVSGRGAGGVDESTWSSSAPLEGPLSDSALSDLADEISVDEWYGLGIQLEIPSAKLSHLQEEHRYSMHDQIFGALRLWRNKVYAPGRDEENLKILIECLRTVGRNDLAMELENKYNIR